MESLAAQCCQQCTAIITTPPSLLGNMMLKVHSRALAGVRGGQCRHAPLWLYYISIAPTISHMHDNTAALMSPVTCASGNILLSHTLVYAVHAYAVEGCQEVQYLHATHNLCIGVHSCCQVLVI
jgi:hypothetical protein